MNTNGQQSDTRWLLDQERRISDAQIESDRNGLTLKGFAKRLRNSMRPDALLERA
jgi:hypothetical protein